MYLFYNTLCEGYWIGSVVHNQIFAAHQLTKEPLIRVVRIFVTQRNMKHTEFAFILHIIFGGKKVHSDFCLSAKQTQLLLNADNLKRHI